MSVLILSKSEIGEIKSKELLVPYRIGPYVIHSYHAKNLLKFIGLEILVFGALIAFSFFFLEKEIKGSVILGVAGFAVALAFICLVYCGIRDVYTISKLRKLSGGFNSSAKWSYEDIEFWKKVAKKRRIRLEDYYSFDNNWEDKNVLNDSAELDEYEIDEDEFY